HTRNFIDCVRSRERPTADVEIGHRSTTLPLLGNIAYRTGRKMRWNAEREEILDDRQASEFLGRQARPPWDLVADYSQWSKHEGHIAWSPMRLGQLAGRSWPSGLAKWVGQCSVGQVAGQS